MRTAARSPPKNLDQVIGGSVGIIFLGIIRFVINTVVGNTFFLNRPLVVHSTIAGGIVLPVIWVVVTSIGKAFIQKDRRVTFLLLLGTMGLAVASLLIAVFGMCNFTPYSITIFDTIIKDFIRFVKDDIGADLFMRNFVDDVIALMIFAFIAQTISLTLKSIKEVKDGKVPDRGPQTVQAIPPVQIQPVPVTCPRCGWVNVPGVRFCNNCANPMVTVPVVQPPVASEITCAYCDGANPPGNITCDFCGRQLASGTQSVSQAASRSNAIAGYETSLHAPASSRGVTSPANGTMEPIKLDPAEIKQLFRQLAQKVEEGFGKLYLQAFQKQPTRNTTWACIGIIVAIIVVVAVIIPVSLSAARPLVGTWHTPFATTFHVRTDFNGYSLQDEGYQERTMTWRITATSNPNLVDVEVSYEVVTNAINSGSGYVPDVSPMFLYGYISGTVLELETHGSILEDPRSVGTFTFTSNIITGTWNDSWCMLYCQEVYTGVNQLTLTK